MNIEKVVELLDKAEKQGTSKEPCTKFFHKPFHQNVMQAATAEYEIRVIHCPWCAIFWEEKLR